MPKLKSNKIYNASFSSRRLLLACAAVVIALLLSTGTFSRVVKAVTCSNVSDCQNQISDLSGKNAASQAQINALELQAQGYQGAIDALNAQIYSLQASINANQARQADLQQKIIANQNEIALKKSQLADDLKTMYIEGNLTTIEELATSKNLSQYVDKQEYQTVVQNKLSSTITEINVLQKLLTNQKAQVDQLLASLKTQQDQLASAQSQQSQLLSLNQGQQDAYNAQVSQNRAKISALQAQQAAIIQAGTRSVGGGTYTSATCNNGNGSGGYPAGLCNTVQDSTTDSGGFPNRECTSYAYWYFTQVEGHGDFSVTGNANQWLRTSNYATHGSPIVGAVAVETAGAFGHVAIVQGLPGDSVGSGTVPAGYLLVSEMNYDFNGHFRYSYSPLSKFAGYIY
ncbi:MAG: CHAP domain-containing protein [Candidatus Saccharimonadales bacterium]